MTRNSGHPFSVEINVVDFADRIRCGRFASGTGVV